jgi:hypothetical protein
MMKHWLFTLIIIFISTILSAQISGVILDKKTGKPIEYANIWVEKQDIGTTSEQNGKFFFEQNILNQKIIVTAIGYEECKILIESSNIKIELNPKTYEIEEVFVRPRKSQELTIDYFKKSSLRNSLICSGTPWIVAKYFEYKPLYEKTPLLKKIKILTISESDSATFNLRLFNANDKGEPTSDILNKNIIVTTQKGKNKTSIDLSDYNISIPREGFFISVEWLIIDRNKSQINNSVSYYPKFGLLVHKEIANNWVFVNGCWKKMDFAIPEDNSKVLDLAIELTLTD